MMNELATNAIESVEVTKKVGSLSERGTESAKEAGERMNKIIKVTNDSAQKVRDLAQKTNEITTVLDVIKQIADQTNLLALNAAIEAARAGEAGRGFAVVADEVRRLAESSAKSSEEIDTKLKQIQEDAQVVVEDIETSSTEVNQGKLVIESSLKSLAEIATQIRGVSENVKKLSDSAQQEVAKVKTVSTNATEIAAVAEENASATEEAAAAVEEQTAQTQEIAASANQMSELAEQLQKLISKFKINAENADAEEEQIHDEKKDDFLSRLIPT
jgi:methyl-accepting chemotaxis protein